MSMHGPDPSYYADMERDTDERLARDRYDESVQDRTNRSYMQDRAASVLPAWQRDQLRQIRRQLDEGPAVTLGRWPEREDLPVLRARPVPRSAA